MPKLGTPFFVDANRISEDRIYKNGPAWAVFDSFVLIHSSKRGRGRYTEVEHL